MIKKKDQFHRVSDLLDNLFEARNYTQIRNNFKAFHDWDQIVGPDIANNTEPLKFQRDVLVIKVRNSVWTQELQFLKPQLLEKIRASFPETKIKDLIFKIGPVTKSNIKYQKSK